MSVKFMIKCKRLRSSRISGLSEEVTERVNSMMQVEWMS
jgi:hypothetical protein